MAELTEEQQEASLYLEKLEPLEYEFDKAFLKLIKHTGASSIRTEYIINHQSYVLEIRGAGINSQSTRNSIVDKNQLSGCALMSLIENDIGYKDIALYSNTYELLKNINSDSLVDSLCNDNDRDLHSIIKGLFASEIATNSVQEKALMGRLNALLSELN